ncbi:MAG: cupin domain-containing protein [Saprospiraceae bacterium]|nr:cupin domain-containing protein [Saprospiraceae bacterium]
MDLQESEKSKLLIMDEMIGYLPHSIVIKTIIRRTTGSITAVSFDVGEIWTEKTSPFDTFIQVIEGKAEVWISGKLNQLMTGESIIMPAHSPHFIKAAERLKIISTVIKSGYE